MISTLKGRLMEKRDSCLLLEVGGIGYEVQVANTALNELKNIPEGQEIELVTFHYYASEPSKSVPVLIGFMNEIEKEFFEKFITVAGIGPKAAVRAINKPISEIARAIDSGDVVSLKSLPGIGEQRAREIIAKLQNKIGKFGLIQDGFKPDDIAPKEDIEKEAMQVLVQLQYKKQQAQDMIKSAIDRNPDISTSEELLNEVYRQRKQL
ncbi:MAG: Holliday junction branch migration protein RuvA [Candidatus Omnitrophica bacterium]|nr:Holliday junction branch migration protein RuvA [Candidatus Omnitrophota bacterium]